MKVVPQLTNIEAAKIIEAGDTLLVGGFGMTGSPVHLLHALADLGTKNLTYVGNNVGEVGLGGGRLLRNGQLRKAVASFLTSNQEAVRAAQAGELEVELIPQGTLGEAIRAGGAGIGGFYTPTAAGTDLAHDRECKVIDGKTYLYQAPIKGNVALIRAWKADTAGNLVYRMTEQNFNRAMATAADTVIVEAEYIVALGELKPDEIHTPCCYVDYLVQAHTRLEELGSSASIANSDKKVNAQRLLMAKAALAELRPGDIVNLGIGIPTLVADLVSEQHGIIMHTENGMLGVGPEPKSGGALDYPVNAGKIPVTALAGSSYFDSADSFAMIRGGHISVAIMGGLQVDESGNLANWSIPGKPLLGVGGAMDLASGAQRLVVTMTHCNKDGSSKVLPQCTLPLTTQGAVDTLITDKGIFRFRDGKMFLTGLIGDTTLDDICANTSARFVFALDPIVASLTP